MEPLARYSEIVVDHLRHPRNPGELPAPAARGEAANEACGDRIVFTAALREGRVATVRFLAEGCPATLAAASRLTERLLGLALPEALALTPELLAADLGGLPEGRFHGAELACRAARAALAGAKP